MTNTFVPPRGPDGKILLSDPAPAVTAPPAPAAPPRTLADLLPSHQRTPAPAAPNHSQQRGMLLGVVAALLMAGALIVWQMGAERAAPVAVPQAPPPAAPTIAPQPTMPGATARPSLPIGLAAYFAPGGTLAPSLPATAAYTPTGRYQRDWVLLDVAGYKQSVWVRADTVPQVDLAALDDLTPPPTPTPAPVVIVRQLPAPPPVFLDCTRDRAVYIASRTSRYGNAEAWSCESQAQADARADASMADIERKATQQ